MKGLFDQVVGALNNPNQQANPNQIGSIVGALQQVSNTPGLDANTTQALVNVVGNHVRTALTQQQQSNNPTQAENLVSRFSGTGANPEAVQCVLGEKETQATIEDGARATGLNPATVQALLPVLIPLVLNFLQTGASTQNQTGSNSVLQSFLQGSGSGFDMGSALSMASQLLQSR
ncbi:DUF937 domain-containing protein [Synechococcales cyanobacterium C]|uniref:DUF937 domain-containing protein n=1 Tax=Petrachloros mirabilis ULC683 TaxID=2781853 RepID=A0A8K2A8G0_9CYAN|nr:DUF937 domain-containing protein [Petrachloros mirabilis]NCJ07164.1 DUF937 domain-containing protein [Petrachloros mirabilis ULC683]